MEGIKIPIELISYRDLLKSFYDIARGNFMNKQNNQNMEKIDTNVFQAIKKLFVYTVYRVVNLVERLLFVLMFFYDSNVYKPLKEKLSPVVKTSLRNNKPIFMIDSNMVTLSRTMLFIPIVWFLKYNYSFAACLTVIIHAFFGHLDGIVARVHGVLYPDKHDPLLSRFLIAFCNKIVNLLVLLAILQIVRFDNCNYTETIFYCFVVYALIAYDVLTAIIRVKCYYEAILIKDKSKMALKATLEWKLKTKLESIGIAALCLASNKSFENPVLNRWGIFGLSILLFTIRMAHKTLKTELLALYSGNQMNRQKIGSSSSADNLLKLINDKTTVINKTVEEETPVKKLKRSVSLKPIAETQENEGESSQNSLIGLYEDETKASEKLFFVEEDENESRNTEDNRAEYNVKNPFQFVRRMSVPAIRTDNRVDKVYTIGCFDLFHYGHIRLIERMREVGKKVIIGVHDSRSIYKLKNRVPVDSTEKRMLNVKQHADEVFCIASTDPSMYMKCIVSLDENETATYIRGDDMPNFPAREVVEKLMPIKLLPYTQGVSSTQLRKEKYSHIRADDEEYLESNN